MDKPFEPPTQFSENSLFGTKTISINKELFLYKKDLNYNSFKYLKIRIVSVEPLQFKIYSRTDIKGNYYSFFQNDL